MKIGKLIKRCGSRCVDFRPIQRYLMAKIVEFNFFVKKIVQEQEKSQKFLGKENKKSKTLIFHQFLGLN